YSAESLPHAMFPGLVLAALTGIPVVLGGALGLLVARALMQDARLLLLDEPFTGMDANSADRLSDLLDGLAREGRALMVATHDLEQARAWDLVLCLNRRQIAFGPPQETLTRPVLEATYGGAIVRLPGDGAGEELGVLPPHHHHHSH
ncbi:MAG: hypothetical protein QOK04_893, partial [Solirubrobacteraceae bacterium]|nr:hypothetical protein [Solirubrobacteraceae bacterium]